MENKNLPTTAQAITNTALRKATNTIIKASDNVNKNMFTIAKTLVQISESECFKDDGFKNVADYGKQVFNYEKSTVYNFVNIGKMFTDSEKLTSNLNHTDHDYSMSQLARLIPLGSSEVANELIEQGKFNENSTIKEIEKAVKEWQNGDVVDSTAEEVDTEPVEETTEQAQEETTDILAIQKVTNNGVWQAIVVDMNRKIVYIPETVGVDSYKDCVSFIQDKLNLR